MDVLARLNDDLRTQRDFVASRAPALVGLFDALCTVITGPVAERLALAWASRRFGGYYERPLLLAAALRDDALREGLAHPLWPTLAAEDWRPAEPAEVAAALDPQRAHLWRSLAARHVQTNETSRAVAWLWPASLLGERPVALFDVGCSAGLNLIADRLPWIWTPVAASAPADATVAAGAPAVASRTGYDLRPLDVRDEDDARWLRACIWPGQRDRQERLEQAIAAFRAMAAGPEAPRIEAVGAGDLPARLPAFEGTGTRGIAIQTVMRDYLPADERVRYEAGMREWLGRSAPGSAVWVELEVLPRDRPPGPPAAITAHVRTDAVRSFVLARCEPHPRVLDVDAEAVAAFVAAAGR